jgi:GLPGLI family protein
MKYKILIFFICFAGIVSGQTYPRIFRPQPRWDIDKYDSIDRGNLRVWYVLNPDDSQKDKTELCEDLQILETGENLSKYYSYFAFCFDSLSRVSREKARKTNKDVAPYPQFNYEACIYWSECFKNYSENSFTEYARMALNIPKYVYSESLPSFDWQLEEDTLTVAGYVCQKATCRFRGRDYISWFTADIPLDNGPWKFGGLPGLILKIYDSDKKFVFECINIEYKNFSITEYDCSDYQKSTREKTLKLQNKIQSNYFQTANLLPENGRIVTTSTRKPVYNTLLLELE